MTSLSQMGILGVRSFSPGDASDSKEQRIKFGRPLTIIVGKNGSGKTTIIEALKFACTGSPPPFTPASQAGQAFVHDPKVGHNPGGVVKARVRLKFVNVSGETMTVTRHMQCQQSARGKSKGKLTYKTLETSLTGQPRGKEKYSVSSKCADIDVQMPSLLGVSKAVLENVIFCHQEESNWPLMDPATLKKKFDDIFASTRYTKALKAIRDFRKDKGQETKLWKKELDTLQVKMDSASELQRQIRDREASIAEAAAEFNDQMAKQNELDGEIKVLEKMLQDSKHLRQRVDEQKMECTLKEKNLKEQKKRLQQEYKESDVELESFENQFEQRAQEATKDLKALEQQIKTLNIQHQKALKEYHSKNNKLIKLETMAEEHAKLKKARDAIISETEGIRSWRNIFFRKSDYSEEDAKKFQQSLDKELKKAKSALEEAQENAEKEDEKFTQRIEEFTSRLLRLKSEIKDHTSHKSKATKEIKMLETNIRRGKDAIELARDAEAAANEAEEAMQRVQTEFDIQAGRNELKEMTKAKKLIDSNLRKATQKFAKLSKVASEVAVLESKKADIAAKTQSLNEIVQRARASLVKVVGEWPEDLSDMERRVNYIASQQKRELKQKTKELRAAERKHDHSKTQHEVMDARQIKLSKQKEKAEEILEGEGVQAHTLEDEIRQERSKVDSKKKHLATVNAASIIYEQFSSIAEAKHHCPLCERSFDSSKTFDAFYDQKIKNKLAQGPSAIKKLEEAIQGNEQRLIRLEQLRDHASTFLRVEKEMNDQRAKGHELQQAMLAANSALIKLRSAIGDMEQKERAAIDAQRVARDITMEARKLEELKRDVQEEERHMGGRAGSMEEVEKQQKKLTAESEALDQKMEILRSNVTCAETRVREAIDNAQELKAKFLQLKSQGQNIHDLEARLKETRNQLHVAEDALPRLKEEAIALNEQKKEVERERKETTENHRRLIKDGNKELRTNQRRLDQFASLQTKVAEGARSSGKEAMDSTQEAVKDAREKCSEIDSKIHDLQSKVEKKNKLVVERQNILRDVKENLVYRKAQRDLKTLKDQLAVSQQELAQIQGDVVDGNRQFQEKTSARHAVSEERARVEERLAMHKRDLRQCQQRLRVSNHAKIQRDFMSRLAEIKTAELADKDLERYHDALDNALMKYHTMKMSEINKIIKELWQATYQGGDIDTIKIVSDESEDAKRRTYNYRLVLVKTTVHPPVQLDMRGRCSAGQKVLSCLIVRMALAETFGLNCGILTLDEPTTNLDFENVRRLAAGLREIIQRRRQQENFQLVLITHDPSFVRLLAQGGDVGFPEHYYEVSKNDEQESVVREHDIETLG